MVLNLVGDPIESIIPDRFGIISAWRYWIVDKEDLTIYGGAFSPQGEKYVPTYGEWFSGENKAECKPNVFYSQIAIKDEHVSPTEDCCCGFHAYYDLDYTLTKMKFYTRKEFKEMVGYRYDIIHGTAFLYGDIVHHTNYIRGEYAVPIAFNGSGVTEIAQKLSRKYGMVCCYNDKDLIEVSKRAELQYTIGEDF